MDTEKQRQCSNNARLTESGNTRSEQLLVMLAELLTNREWLPGEFLCGPERQRLSWNIRLVQMKWPTTFCIILWYYY